MTDISFDQSLALSLYQTGEQFPIDFEDAWMWLGYANKASTKRRLARFSEGLDFSTFVLKNGQRGRSSELIMISIDCFKCLAMMAETDAGDVARMHFLNAENLLKEMISTGKTYSEIRGECKDMQNPFMLACIHYKFNAAKAHNAITVAVCGKTASESRELDVVDGNASVGLNHIMSPEVLADIASVKYHFSRYHKGSIEERVTKAVKDIAKEKRKSLKPGK